MFTLNITIDLNSVLDMFTSQRQLYINSIMNIMWNLTCHNLPKLISSSLLRLNIPIKSRLNHSHYSQEHLNNYQSAEEKTLQSLDSVKTSISDVNDPEHALSIKDFNLQVDDNSNGNSILAVNKENNESELRKNSGAVLSVNGSDLEGGFDTRKNSNTSIRTVQSMPKYTECMAADKPFANISNKRMMDNITRAVSKM